MSGTHELTFSKFPLLLAAVTIASLATASSADAQRRGGTTPFCLSGGLLCVNATPQEYNRCYSLALRQGWSSRRSDDYGRNNFVYQCLGGRGRR